MARAWKARIPKGIEGSNPSLSAVRDKVSLTAHFLLLLMVIYLLTGIFKQTIILILNFKGGRIYV